MLNELSRREGENTLCTQTQCFSDLVDAGFEAPGLHDTRHDQGHVFMALAAVAWLAAAWRWRTAETKVMADESSPGKAHGPEHQRNNDDDNTTAR